MKNHTASSSFSPSFIFTNTTLATTTILSLSTMNTTEEDFLDTDLQIQIYLGLVVPVLFGIIAVVGLVGNGMVIGSVLVNRQMRQTTNLLILHLALADLLFIVFCVPFTAVSYVITEWPFGDAWCKIYQYMNMVTAVTSVYTLVLMSLDRYLAVCHPIRSIDIRSPQKTLLAIWVVTGIISLSLCPFLKNFENFQFTEDVSRCANVRIKEDPSHHKIFQICFFAFGFAIPLGLVCLLYGLMLHRLLYGGVKNRRVAGKAQQKSKKRVTRLVIVVVVSFAVCWLPIHIIFLVQASSRQDAEDENSAEDDNDDLVFAQVAAQCLAYLNSCINPFLYAFLSEQFRKSFMSLFARCRSRNPAPRVNAAKPAAAIAASVFIAANPINNKKIECDVDVESIELKRNELKFDNVGENIEKVVTVHNGDINLNIGTEEECERLTNDLDMSSKGISTIYCV